MTRLTPLPLLRDLTPNVLVVRCGLCQELVLASECCGDITLAPSCPRRAMLESGLVPLVMPPIQHPLMTGRLDG